MKNLSKFRLIRAASAFPRATVGSSIHGEMWGNFARLLIILAATFGAIALATSVSEAHDQAFCDDDGEDTHYIRDVVANPPGRFMLYVESTHDHVVVKAGDGVSGLSVQALTKNNDGTTSFNYLGTDIEMPADNTVFAITFTTSQVDAVVKICS